MAKSSNYKLKLLYLVKMFSEESDEEHALVIGDIQRYLAGYNINADRKTLYTDFEVLRDFGYDIVSRKEGNKFYYYLGDRDFQLPELKLLVDAVQSAKFLTEKRTNELIKKLEKLASKNQGRYLQRQVYIAGRVKALNERIYYNVDTLHDAINKDSRIAFEYFKWSADKRLQKKKDGKPYMVSPWALMWDDENYYLVAFDEEEEKIKHYRVDKMENIRVLNEPRNGKTVFDGFDLPRYTKSLFGMFGGEETRVALEVHNDLIGVIIDRFGKDIAVIKLDEEHFKTTVNVTVSRQFLGWVVSLGEQIKITGPDKVVDLMKEEIKRLKKQYT